MTKRRLKLSNHILEEASSWFIELHDGDGDAGTREDFNSWLRRSPEHVRGYLEISTLWEYADGLRMRRDLNIDELVARAIAEQNVFPFDVTVGSTESRSAFVKEAQRPRAELRFRTAIAATVLLGIGIGVATWSGLNRNRIYATEIGEQRSITLEDGSSLELNSRSRLQVRFTKSERAVKLLEGQALFRVARNPTRPFIVTTGDTSVRAVGTKFDVYQKKSGTVVTVIEGRVAVDSARSARAQLEQPRDEKIGQDSSAVAVEVRGPGSSLRAGEVLLSAGEQLTVTSWDVALPKPANLAIATAWIEKKLVFESTPLPEVVEEFNRYNRQQLAIRDPELRDLHVSGVFPSTDSDRMVEFLQQRFGVIARASGDEIEIFRRGASD